MTRPSSVTQLLRDWRSGQPDALDRLTPLVYDELKRLADRFMKRERPGHTLQATAIVHEVLLRSFALGARYVLVWGTSGNPEAKALYLGAGLGTRRVLRDYRLALD